jgi:hypothetical protein
MRKGFRLLLDELSGSGQCPLAQWILRRTLFAEWFQDIAFRCLRRIRLSNIVFRLKSVLIVRTKTQASGGSRLAMQLRHVDSTYPSDVALLLL